MTAVFIAGVALISSRADLFFPLGVSVIMIAIIMTSVLIPPFFDNMSTSLITKLYLKARFDLGEERSASESHKEVLGGDSRKRRLPKISRRLGGRINFLPYRPPVEAENDSETSEGEAPILGIAQDIPYHQFSATFRGSCWSLLSDDEVGQLDRLAAFAYLLDRFAETGNPICRFKWQIKTTIGTVLNPVRTVKRVREDAGFNANPLLDATSLFADMERMAKSSIDEHRLTFTLTLDPSQLGDELEKAGSVEAVLYDYMAAFYASLQLDGLSSSPLGLMEGYALDYNQLLLENRLALDPVFAHPVIKRMQAAGQDLVFANQQPAWPKFFDFSDPEFARVGETIHMGFYIEDTPSNGLSPTQLWSIIKLPIPKTITVVYAMLPVRQAERRAQWAANAAYVARGDSERSDVRVTRAEARAQEALEQHEDELALNVGQDGRARIYIDVVGAAVEEARNNALQLRNAALAARFLIEPLTGRQQDGLEVLMPAGRGLFSSPFQR